MEAFECILSLFVKEVKDITFDEIYFFSYCVICNRIPQLYPEARKFVKHFEREIESEIGLEILAKINMKSYLVNIGTIAMTIKKIDKLIKSGNEEIAKKWEILKTKVASGFYSTVDFEPFKKYDMELNGHEDAETFGDVLIFLGNYKDFFAKNKDLSNEIIKIIETCEK